MWGADMNTNELGLEGYIFADKEVEEIERLFFEFLGANNLFFGGAIYHGESVDDGYIEGLKKSIEIIKKEQEYAKECNVFMAMGMEQAIVMIKKEIKALKNKKSE